MFNIFTDSDNKLILWRMIVAILFLFIIIALVVAIFTTKPDSSKEVIEVNHDIPQQNKDVYLEDDKSLQFITRDELEVLINRNTNEKLEIVRNEIDQDRRDFINKLFQEQNDFEISLEQELEDFKSVMESKVNTINNYNFNNEINNISNNLNEESKKINELEIENDMLKNRIDILENNLKKISNRMLSADSNNSLSSNIPSNNYGNSESNDEVTKEDDELKINNVPFSYVGVVEGENMCAIVEMNGKNYTLEENDNFRGYVIKEITSSYIKVDYNGTELSVDFYR